MRRERCIGRNKWGRVPIWKLRSSSSGRRQGSGGGHDHGNNAEQHETNSRKAPSSSPPDSSPDAVVVPGSATTRSIAAPAAADAKLPPHTVVVPGLHVLFKGMDGQTRPVAGLTGDSTLGDLFKALVVLGQSSSSAFGLLYRGRPVRNDPGVLLCTVLTGGGDHLLVQCPHEPGGMPGLHPYQQPLPSDDDDDDQVQSAAESPSAAPDMEVTRAYCWFFEMTLVVGEAHIVANQISKTIVEDVFKTHEQYQLLKLSKLKVITFSLQTDPSKLGGANQLKVEGFIQSSFQIRKITANEWMPQITVKWTPICR